MVIISSDDSVRSPAVSPQVAYFQFSLDKLNEAIKQSKVKILIHPHTTHLFITHIYMCTHWPFQGQPEHVQEALKFTMDVIGGK